MFSYHCDEGWWDERPITLKLLMIIIIVESVVIVKELKKEV